MKEEERERGGWKRKREKKEGMLRGRASQDRIFVFQL